MLMIAAVASGSVDLLPASMVAVGAMLVGDILTPAQAAALWKIRTTMIIAGAFGLSKAIGKTSVASAAATALCNCVAPLGLVALLSALFLCTVLLGVVFHSTAVVVLLFPVCLHAREVMDIPVHLAIGPLLLGSACLFLSNTSYQTNVMATAAGAYTFADFSRVGAPAVVVMMLVGVPTMMATLQ